MCILLNSHVKGNPTTHVPGAAHWQHAAAHNPGALWGKDRGYIAETTKQKPSNTGLDLMHFMWLSTADIPQLITFGFEFMRTFTDLLSDTEEYDPGRGAFPYIPGKLKIPSCDHFFSPQWTVSTGTIIRKFSLFSQILLIFFNRLCPCDKCRCIVGGHIPTYQSSGMSRKPPMISTEDSLDARSMATMRTVQDMSGSQDFDLR